MQVCRVPLWSYLYLRRLGVTLGDCRRSLSKQLQLLCTAPTRGRLHLFRIYLDASV